jgi:hypothetical protein
VRFSRLVTVSASLRDFGFSDTGEHCAIDDGPYVLIILSSAAREHPRLGGLAWLVGCPNVSAARLACKGNPYPATGLCCNIV